MEPSNPYFDQVRLLVEILPIVARRTEFALKGGTAINLFFRDMPRLSVDIDLVYLPVQDRDKSLTVIDAALVGLAEELGKGASGMSARFNFLKDSGTRDKVIINRDRVEVKIEVATVLRGSLFPPEIKSVGAKVRERFGPAEMPLLRFEEVFAGKICAALDRQHPRDLFDIDLLLKNEGIQEGLKDAFLVYLISNSKPIVVLLDPTPKDVSRFFKLEFEGMDESSTSLETLVEARRLLVESIHGSLTDNDKEFLIGLKKGVPDWSRFPIPNVEALPAV